MGISLLYQKIIQGGFYYFGNALGLTRGSGSIIPGTLPSQGAFMTVDTTTAAAGGWPNGTTLDWKLGSSYCYVDIPSDSVIDEAFLIWGGSTGASVGSAARLYPVYLITPDNVKHIVTPGTTLIGSGFYSSSADVTSILSGSGSGNFICGSIPADITAAATGGEGGGWLLAIATKSPSGGYNYATLCISNDNYGQVGTNIPIVTPSSGVVTGKLMNAVIHAGCDKGDALILQATRPFSAPNREAPNFFNSIISNNSGDGLPYTNASFGNNNNSPSTRSNVLNARQGLDLAIYDTNGDIPSNTTTYYLDGYNGGVAFSPSEGFTNYIAYGTALNPSNATTTLEKSADKDLVNYGDEIIYTLNVVLEGSGSVAKLKLFDTLPDNTTFVSGSVYVNGVNNPTADLVTGITLAQSLNLPYSATVTYRVKVDTTGNFQNIINNFYVTFTNTITGGTVFTNTIVSNFALTTLINAANLSNNKSVDKGYGGIGEILTYTIVLNNTGNLSADNIIFLDTLQNGISLVQNSLFVDGVANSFSGNPIFLNLGSIASNGISTITFKGQVVNTIPSINPIVNNSYTGYSYTTNSGVVNATTISNFAVTTISYGSLYSNKVVSKDVIEIGQILTYTIGMSYFVGNTPAYNVSLIDTLPGEVSLVAGSLKVNGVSSFGSLSAPGLSIGTIPVGGISTVTFQVKVNSVPSGNSVINDAYIKYDYKSSLTGSTSSFNNTNIVSTTIVNPNAYIQKYVDKINATTGEVLNYIISIKNTGNIDLKNSLFKDTIPSGTTYVNGSLKVNGVSSAGNLNGLILNTISVNTTTTIEYSVLVN